MLFSPQVPNKNINIEPIKRNEALVEYCSKDNKNLSIFLIKNILTYMEPKFIIKNCLFLNKAIHTLFQFKIFEKNIKTEYLLKGRQEMNEIYVEYDIDQILRKTNLTNEMLLNIEFEIESKDQGWACLNNSNSWVELKIIEKVNESAVKI